MHASRYYVKLISTLISDDGDYDDGPERMHCQINDADCSMITTIITWLPTESCLME